MANVLDITPHLPERPTLDVDLPLQILTRMLQIGKISRHAYGIGALALSRMQEAGEYKCVLTRQSMANAAVRIDGEPMVSIGQIEIDTLAHALHALQYNCGLWNHVQEHRVGKGTVRYNHFTEKHYGEGDYAPLYKIIKSDTPICFAWLPEHEEELVADARKVISHALEVARWADVRTTKL